LILINFIFINASRTRRFLFCIKKIYPNPACSSVFITTSEANGSVQLQDITGNIIVQKQVTGTLTSFDIHSIPRGIYFAVWNDGSGAKSVQKFVVE
jgi:hypothetical protein